MVGRLVRSGNVHLMAWFSKNNRLAKQLLNFRSRKFSFLWVINLFE